MAGNSNRHTTRSSSGSCSYAVWTNFETADGNAEAEANSLINAVRAAQGLPDAQRQEIQHLASEYVEDMLTREWPAMQKVQFSPRSHQIMQKLWEVTTREKLITPTQQTSFDHTLTELSAMTAHRRLRQLQATAGMPPILWTVLTVGAIVTIISACLFGGVDFKLHLIQVFMLSLLLSLVLVAIADINRPFQGSVHVIPAGFQRARASLNDMSAAR